MLWVLGYMELMLQVFRVEGLGFQTRAQVLV